MLRMLLLAAAGLCLSACTTTNISTDDAAKLAAYCQKAAAAHTAFVLADLFQFIPERAVAVEKAAWAVAGPICADPSSMTLGSALTAVAGALDDINAALAETK